MKSMPLDWGPKRSGTRFRQHIGLVHFALALAVTASAQTVTQVIPLHSGWNAIWIEITPTNQGLEAVFANLPVESVWTYLDKTSSADFIRNQEELPWNNPGWRRWFPTNSEKAVLTTLFAVQAHRPYLVRLSGTGWEGALEVTGTPAIPRATWRPDAFNLRGFPIDPDARPTFGDFFGDAPAHSELLIFRLPSDGKWRQVQAEEPMASGEAYWVYCRGPSDFIAPLELELGWGDMTASTVLPTSRLEAPMNAKARAKPRLEALEYGAGLQELSLRAHNRSSLNRLVTLQEPDGRQLPLAAYQKLGSDLPAWVRLRDFEWGLLEPGAYRAWRLAVQRTRFATATYAGVLEIRDHAGTRYQVAVTAVRDPGVATSSQTSRRAFTRSSSDSPCARAGLWVGNVTLEGVTELAPLAVTTSFGDANTRASAVFHIVGPDNDFQVTALQPGGEWNGLRVTLSPQQAPGSSAPKAVYDASEKILSIQFAGGRTKAIDLIQAINRLSENGFNSKYSASAANGETNSTGSVAGATQTRAANGEGSNFSLRLIVHVGTDGSVKLLKEVYEVWLDSNGGPDGSNQGRYALLSDAAKLQEAAYRGTILDDGTLKGRRISSVGFDFRQSSLPLGDSFETNSILGTEIKCLPTDPTNPFYHRYHPDHGQSGIFQGKPLSFEIKRSIQLYLSATALLALPTPDYGAKVLDGVYTETLEGLHREPLLTVGTFRLTRVSSVSQLD